MKKKTVKIIFSAILIVAVMSAMSLCAFADGNVAGAIEGTWKSASGQIKTVVAVYMYLRDRAGKDGSYEDKKYHNVVFVGTDENGIPKQASVRSTLKQTSYYVLKDEVFEMFVDNGFTYEEAAHNTNLAIGSLRDDFSTLPDAIKENLNKAVHLWSKYFCIVQILNKYILDWYQKNYPKEYKEVYLEYHQSE